MEELQVIATVIILTKYCVHLLHQCTTLVRDSERYSEYRLFITYTNTLSAVLVCLSFIALHHPLTLKKKTKTKKYNPPSQTGGLTYIQESWLYIQWWTSTELFLSTRAALGTAWQGSLVSRDQFYDAHCHQLHIWDRKLLICNSRNKAVDEKAVLSTSPHFSVFLGSQFRIITSLKGPMPCQVAET